jgi:Ran GTPase-activating protein (RanGAP) involved in mRNA processing and transport
LQSNITLKRIIGKIPPGIISEDLKDNVTIEADITNKYKTLAKNNKQHAARLPLHSQDGDYTQLDLSNQANELLTPALKFIRYRSIHGVNLSNMQLEDESLRLISLYLEENPILRSLAIADNFFTDDGLGQLVQALRGNTHMNHLDIQGCQLISSLSIKQLEDMITEVNMSLYAVEIEEDQFDPSLVRNVLTQARYNKAIQMHLKPVKAKNESNGLIEIQFEESAGVGEHFDAAIKAWRIMGPTMIKAVNEGLGDAHVKQLCGFLSNRNLIKSLNLRRNKIGNPGAIALANFIRKSDKTLQVLELERNEIHDEGGEEILKAAQSNMRIECCNMSFGNPMRQKICR